MTFFRVPIAVAVLCTTVSCSHTFHLPYQAKNLPSPTEVIMRVGERRKLVSEKLFSNFSLSCPAAAIARSLQPEFAAVEHDVAGHISWVVARKPGLAIIVYFPFDYPDVLATRIHVKP